MNILQDHTTTIASLANISILLDMKPTTYNARTVEWKTYAFTIRYNVKANSPAFITYLGRAKNVSLDDLKNLLGDNVPRKYFKFSDYVRTLRRIMTLSIIMQKVPEIELTEDYGLWINWDYDLHSVSLKDNSLIMTSIATLEPIGTFTQRIALEMFAKDEALIIERG